MGKRKTSKSPGKQSSSKRRKGDQEPEESIQEERMLMTSIRGMRELKNTCLKNVKKYDAPLGHVKTAVLARDVLRYLKDVKKNHKEEERQWNRFNKSPGKRSEKKEKSRGKKSKTSGIKVASKRKKRGTSKSRKSKTSGTKVASKRKKRGTSKSRKSKTSGTKVASKRRREELQKAESRKL